MTPLRFRLNGRPVEISGVPPHTTLLRWLRDHAGLTGTKEGCAEGDCGACTVAVLERDGAGAATWRAINACLLLLPMVSGKQVVTVEGLKDGEAYHPAQAALAQRLGSQCGYCTPGVVMTLFEATYRPDLRAGAADGGERLDDQLCGNLCRCTGYRPIRDAALDVGGTCPDDRFRAALGAPPAAPAGLAYEAAGARFETPATLDDLWSILERDPDARLVAGGTDLGLEVTKRHARPPRLVSLEGIAALRGLTFGEQAADIGAAVRLTDLADAAGERLVSVHRMLRYFGSRQIKSRATVGGNLCTASPIGDLAPVLLALDARAVLRSRRGTREVPLDAFFTGYRKTALAPGEILARVVVPLPTGADRVGVFKVSKRREVDISAVAAGFCVRVDRGGTVTAARLAFGGMAATPARAPKAEAALVGRPFDEAAVAAAAARLAEDFTPLSDHRASAAYRLRVAGNLLAGFLDESRAGPLARLPRRHTATVLAG